MLGAVFLIVALGIAWRLVVTKPRPQLREPSERAALVRAVPLEFGAQTVEIESSGTVLPAREVDLQARVTGEVVEIDPNFLPGGRLPAGRAALRIDPQDYRLQVELRQADVVQARQAQRIEQGRQDIARHEWSLFNHQSRVSDLDRELALRQPQLLQAEAAATAAEVSLRQAQLDLDRTEVKVPFNSVVLSRDVDLGAQVSTQTVLGRLAGTDEFWVLLQLAVSDLNWIGIGDKVSLRAAGLAERGLTWEGTVIQKQVDLEENGRLARVLVSVSDPLKDPDRPLLLGMYVRARIQGKLLEGVFPVPRTTLRDDGSLWLVGEDSRLRIQPVKTVWAGSELALVRGELVPGTLMVVSNLAAPIEGMLLKVMEQGSGNPETME